MQIPVWYWRLTQIRTGQVGPLVFALACIAEKRKFMINVSIWLQARFVARLTADLRACVFQSRGRAIWFMTSSVPKG